ncbi:MAG: hypothetical protein FWH36_07795 [Lentimicrobiaceae bacterium]|nr:hypothetical protein [Lentimicrobiaceae bacterium]
MITLSKNSGTSSKWNSTSEVNIVVEQNPSVTKTELRPKEMRMFCFQKKLLSVVIVSLIVSTCFFSCLKEKYHTLSDIINNSIWTSGTCERSFTVPDSDTIKDLSLYSNYYYPFTISFLEGEAVIIANFNYTYNFLDSMYNYYEDRWEYFWQPMWGTLEITFKGIGTYVCDGNNITIKNIKWDYETAEAFGGEEWTGTYNANDGSMELKNVFGDMATFRIEGAYLY